MGAMPQVAPIENVMLAYQHKVPYICRPCLQTSTFSSRTR